MHHMFVGCHMDLIRNVTGNITITSSFNDWFCGQIVTRGNYFNVDIYNKYMSHICIDVDVTKFTV